MVKKPNTPAPQCCGKPSRWISQQTFGYWYCDSCKEEPGNKLEVPKHTWDTPPPFARGAGLPNGYAALKGEDITCSDCGIIIGTLNQDLPVITNRTGTLLYNYFDYMPSPVMHMGSCTGDWVRSSIGKPSTIHVKGRGWV